MRAIVRSKPGGPSVLTLDSDYPKPAPKKGHVLIQVKAIGLNRSELRARAGEPPITGEFTSDALSTTELPKILGEECIGIVVSTGGSRHLKKGDTVATYFCGIGRVCDGSYAEYTLVPARFAYKLDTEMSWDVIGGLPAMFMTAWGSLHRALDISHEKEEVRTLLVHGGTSSIGSAAIMLAAFAGCHVAATTRQEHKADALRECGAEVVLIDKDDGTLGGQLRKHNHFKDGAENVLELVGLDKIGEAFSCTKSMGTVCMTGALAKCSPPVDSAPIDGIESGKKLTTFRCCRDAAMSDHTVPLQALIKNIEMGNMDPTALRGLTLMGLESIMEAHELMEANKVSGKIVVLL